MNTQTLYQNSLSLLEELIKIPSYSREENKLVDFLEKYLEIKGFECQRFSNNLLLRNKCFDLSKKTVVLCSHHDTVRPNSGYSFDAHSPFLKDGKLYGLGSNDAGASLVSLISVFEWFYNCDNLKYNLTLLLCAEEEVSGRDGIELMKAHIDNVELLVVGEPTSMDVAIAERGLMVLDCYTVGVSGHAANPDSINPIGLALEDMLWFRDYRFSEKSEVLGEVKMNVTVINSGEQHNVVPAECKFTVDIRNNGCYTNKEILEIVRENVGCRVEPRSTRLNPSSISVNHKFVESCIKYGSKPFGSNTMSDQALVDWQSVKIGVGESSRSHTSDEFV